MNKVYVKKDLVQKVTKKLDKERITIGGNKHAYKRKYHLRYSTPIVRKVISALLEVLVEVLEEGDTVSLTGYFTIEPVYYKESRGWNIPKQESIKIPAQYRPRVKFATYFKKACKKLTERELGGQDDEES